MNGLVKMTPLNIDGAFDDLVRRSFTAKSTSWMPAADIIQDGEDVLIILDLPGIDSETLDLELKDRVLRVAGSRGEHMPSSMERLIRAEIRRGDFARTFRIPSYVTADAISAAYDDGVLQIRIRGAQPVPMSQKIEIRGIEKPHAAVDAPELIDPTE